MSNIGTAVIRIVTAALVVTGVSSVVVHNTASAAPMHKALHNWSKTNG